MIRVLVVDDHAIVRHGLSKILSDTQDMTVIGEAETGSEAIKLLREVRCDVVLLDISLPDRNGIEILKQIRKEQPKLAVLILSMHAEREFAVRALKGGASGYLTKQSVPTQLLGAIRQVAAGRKYLTPSIAEEVANTIARDSDEPAHETLSNREYQTLCLIASGKTLSSIASELSLSPKTISVYRSRVLEKLFLRNNSDITRYAIKNRLVD